MFHDVLDHFNPQYMHTLQHILLQTQRSQLMVVVVVGRWWQPAAAAAMAAGNLNMSSKNATSKSYNDEEGLKHTLPVVPPPRMSRRRSTIAGKFCHRRCFTSGHHPHRFLCLFLPFLQPRHPLSAPTHSLSPRSNSIPLYSDEHHVAFLFSGEVHIIQPSVVLFSTMSTRVMHKDDGGGRTWVAAEINVWLGFSCGSFFPNRWRRRRRMPPVPYMQLLVNYPQPPRVLVLSPLGSENGTFNPENYEFYHLGIKSI